MWALVMALLAIVPAVVLLRAERAERAERRPSTLGSAQAAAGPGPTRANAA
jgi:hypothetical protein